MTRKIDAEKVRRAVDATLGEQFSEYSWFDMIDDAGLTKAEAKWAKENIGYRAYIVKEEPTIDQLRDLKMATRRILKWSERLDVKP